MKYTLDTLDKFVLWRLVPITRIWVNLKLFMAMMKSIFLMNSSKTWFFRVINLIFRNTFYLISWIFKITKNMKLQALLRNSFGEFPFKNYIFENVDALIWCLVHNILLWTNRFWLLSGVTVCTLMSVIPYALQFWPWSYYKINSTI